MASKESKWADAYLKYIQNRERKCPVCGEKTLTFKFYKHKATEVGYAVAECSSCNEWFNYCRVIIPEGIYAEQVPEDENEGTENV